MSDAVTIILAILGSGGFTALITGLFSANQRRKDRNDSISKKLDDIVAKLDEHIKENEQQFILQDRSRIIAFADECRRKVQHSQEAFNDISTCIDRYEDYCAAHKGFSNSKAEASIKLIKEAYKKALSENTFI